ncbi:uncharacterized protein LOC135346165 [Halichondria panicea]|uniref:uncharacterized protein LOC135346165 n=1 Tax=Halichondria panicea TaxID=6063 RepID=UPI00312B5338
MKDIQGVQRGKCNTCECEEYRTSPAATLPGPLHLRKPRPQQPGAPVTSGQMMSQAQGASGFQPRYDAHEQPLQLVTYGTCKCPGCTFPKRREGDKIHDFCSRTCAKKFNELQSSFHQQKVAATKTAQQGSSSPRAYRQPPGSFAISSGPSSTDKRGAMSYYPKMQGQGPPMLPYDSLPLSHSGGSMPPGPSTQSMPAIAGGKMCSKCRVRQANPGKGWCDQCFMQSLMNS